MISNVSDPDTELIRALAEFRHRLRQFIHFSESAAEHAGLQPQQHQLMLQVAGARDEAAVTVGYVAERLGLRHNSAVELCDRCAQAGLLLRHQNAADRRCVLLELSVKGRRLLESLSLAHARELNELAPELVRVLARLEPVAIDVAKPAVGRVR